MEYDLCNSHVCLINPSYFKLSYFRTTINQFYGIYLYIFLTSIGFCASCLIKKKQKLDKENVNLLLRIHQGYNIENQVKYHFTEYNVS